MSSVVLRGMTTDRSVRFLVIDSTKLVDKAREIHQTLPTSTAAFGRVLTATSMMGMLLKDVNEKTTLQIKGSGAIKSIFAASDCSGNVKGYISHPEVNLPPRADGKIDVGGAIGKEGQLVVVKDFGMKEPFVGQIDLVSGEIAEDLANYFMYSEQQPSIVSLGVFVEEDGTVSAAGGLLIQPMPHADDEVIDKLELAAVHMEPFTNMLKRGMSAKEIIEDTLKAFEIEIMDEQDIDFVCDCSQEKIEKALVSIGEKDLVQIIEEDGNAEIHCHFCNKYYDFDKDALQKLLDMAKTAH